MEFRKLSTSLKNRKVRYLILIVVYVLSAMLFYFCHNQPDTVLTNVSTNCTPGHNCLEVSDPNILKLNQPEGK
jgi:hypothetical protein